MKILIIGDIHANIGELVKVLSKGGFDKVISLGDVFHSKDNKLGEDCLDELIQVGAELVIGNHEYTHLSMWEKMRKGENYGVDDMLQWDWGCEGDREKAARILQQTEKEIGLLGEERMEWLRRNGKYGLVYGKYEFYHGKRNPDGEINRWCLDDSEEWLSKGIKGELELGGRVIFVGHENIYKHAKDYRLYQKDGSEVRVLDWGIKKGVGKLGWEIIDL
jgi:predicted phosphodiesterase